MICGTALSGALRKGAAIQELIPQAECEMLLPASIGDYTDFYASIHHAANVGSMFRPGNPLLPNYKHVPIAYHGRASSIVPSGTQVQRPQGQTGAGLFGPSKNLDYELEIGALLGPGNQQGQPIPITDAEEHIAGLCLVNDWSARDIQRWESQPLGPFLAKNFATSISPWLVTLEALEPFRVDAPQHEIPTLALLANRQSDGLRHHGGSLASFRSNDRPCASQPWLFPRNVLDPGADDCSSHLERMPHSRR